MSKKVLLSLCAATMLAMSAYAQTADELVEKNIKAMGGREKLKAVQSMRLTGKMKMGPMEVPFTVVKARPSSSRMDMTIQGMTATQAFDGTNGWMTSPFQGNKDAQAIPSAMLKQVRADSDFDGPTFDYKAKGNTVEYLGKEDIQGTPAYKLKVTTKDGVSTTVFLDSETYLAIRSESTRNVQGQELEMENTFGDYKAVDGMYFPYSMDSHVKGKEAMGGQAITFDKIEINPKVDAAMFKMPAPAPAEKKDGVRKEDVKKQ